MHNREHYELRMCVQSPVGQLRRRGSIILGRAKSHIFAGSSRGFEKLVAASQPGFGKLLEASRAFFSFLFSPFLFWFFWNGLCFVFTLLFFPFTILASFSYFAKFSNSVKLFQICEFFQIHFFQCFNKFMNSFKIYEHSSNVRTFYKFMNIYSNPANFSNP